MTVYRLAVGHIAKATIEGSDTYVIELFALQSDQNLARPWMVSDTSNYVRRARVTKTANQTILGDGKFEQDIILPYSTRGQAAYIDTLFSFTDSVQSALATWVGLDQKGSWRCFQGKLQRPREGETFTKFFRGAEGLILRCFDGLEVT